MNVTEFTIAIKSLINQLEKYDFVKGDKLWYDLDYFDKVVTKKNEAYFEVKSTEDVLDILSFFNFEPQVVEKDIDKILKEKDINTAMGVALILQMEKPL